MYSNLNLDRCVSWNGLREAAHGVLIITSSSVPMVEGFNGIKHRVYPFFVLGSSLEITI